MEIAGLLNENQDSVFEYKELNPYSQMVGSWAANYVGFKVSISNGDLVDGGSVSGDYLVVGYGRLITDTTGDFNASSKPSVEVLIVQDADGAGTRIQSVYGSISDLKSKIKVIQ